MESADNSYSTPEELAPSIYGNVQLNYRGNRWNGNVGMVAHNGIKVLQQKGPLLVINSNLTYLLAKQWEAGFNVRNLTDKKYSTPQNRPVGQNQFSQNVQEMPARGREFMFSLRFIMGV